MMPPHLTTDGASARFTQPICSLFERALLIYLDAAVMILMRRLGVRGRGMKRRHANLD